MIRIIKYFIIAIPFLVAVCGCATVKERVSPSVSPALVKVRDIPDFSDDMGVASLINAIDTSISYYRGEGRGNKYCFTDTCYSAEEMIGSLETFRDIMIQDKPAAEKQADIAGLFDVYQAWGRDEQHTVIFTGYFEPVLDGSLVRTERFRYPLYRVPPETVTVRLGRFHPKYGNDRIIGRLEGGELLPHFSRREIETGKVLDGRGLELVWVDDPVTLFFLHIQGSGRIRLPGGEILLVNYASSNGRPFRGLARHMVAQGLIGEGEMSYRRVKAYLETHPDQRDEIMNHNESYVFFRIVPEGPLGALGRPVVAHRSIATDLDLFPRGALAFIRLRKPLFDGRGNVAKWMPFGRFVLNHDAGGAIKGPGRVDLFCGTGPEAEQLAGSLSEKGSLFFLVKKRSPIKEASR